MRILSAVFTLATIMWVPAWAFAQQATLTDDAQTSTAAPHQNFGTKSFVQVSEATAKGFFRFKLKPNLPAGSAGHHVGRATLKLFVNKVNSPGAIDIYRVAGAWSESAVTAATAPALGSLEKTIMVNKAQEGKWLSVDLTPLAKDWLDNVLANQGIAFVARAGGANIVFHSKEIQTSSRPLSLEVVLQHAALADRMRVTPVGYVTNADQIGAVTSGVFRTRNLEAKFSHPPGITNSFFGSAHGARNTALGNSPGLSHTDAGPSTSGTLHSARFGLIPVAYGGTGISVAGASGNFLRSDGQSWASVPLHANDIPGGSGHYIQNSSAPQAGVSFNISGNGTLGGELLADSLSAATQYKIRGTRVLSTPGASNIFVGVGTGASNTAGIGNSFFGDLTGFNNTEGLNNSFMGRFAGYLNTMGSHNSFFGNHAGFSNMMGSDNSFFGNRAGFSNTTGGHNSFFGDGAGALNTSGIGNTFIGSLAGQTNTSENNNSFIGAGTNGAPGITNATAIGAGTVVIQSDSVVLGNNARVGIGTGAPKEKLHVNGGNIYIGAPGQGVIFKSVDGATCRLLTVDNMGTLVLTAIACP